MRKITEAGTINLFNSTPGTPTSWVAPGAVLINYFDVAVNGASTTAGPDTCSAILSTVAPQLTVVDGADEQNVLARVQIAIAAASTAGQTGRLCGPCYRIMRPGQVLTLKLVPWSAGVSECYGYVNYVKI